VNKLTYGVIGVTGIGKYRIQRALENGRLQLVALVEGHVDALQQARADLELRVFTGCRDLLDADMVDAVLIATRHHLHAETGLARQCTVAFLP
jgi:predicted dehydrogenase